MLTDEEIIAYLGIDYADEMILKNVRRIAGTAYRILKGAVGEDVDTADERAKEAMLIIAEDLYSSRGMTETVSGNTRRLLTDIYMQLRIGDGKFEGV
ncbi:MAG: hypothetical protein Q4G33_07490 [bacterium]|nr:hypothetical protein [bacterium]